MATDTPEAIKLKKLWDKFIKDSEELGFVPKDIQNITFDNIRTSKSVISGDVIIPIEFNRKARARILKRALRKGKRKG